MQTNSIRFYPKKNIFDLSIIVPVYNNEEKIGQTLEKIKSVLEVSNLTYELIVVNDGSTDKTLAILEFEREKDPKVRILSYPRNRGKGYAVKTGVMTCEGSKCMFIDGDLDISPNSMTQYFRELKDCDLVIASKRHVLSNVDATQTRKFLSHAFGLFVKIVTGIAVNDTQSGLKCGDTITLQKIFSSMTVSRYAFDVELLVLASKVGLKIKELPVDMILVSKFKLKDIIRMCCDVLHIAYRYRVRTERIIRNFKSDLNDLHPLVRTDLDSCGFCG